MTKTFEPVPFIKDRAMLLLLTIDSLLVLSIVGVVIARLRSHDFKVPVQYVVNDGSVLQVSEWYTLYSLAAFAVLTGVATFILAQRLHKSERNYAMIALIVFGVSAVFGLLTTNALLGLGAGV